MLDGVTRRRLAGGERDVEIALLDWGGDGPLALLHHANGFCAALWAEVAAGLRDRYRVVALDARGHGDSSKPENPAAYAWKRFVDDATAVASALAADHPDGIALGLGHSFGGLALLGAAAARPGLFARLVLVDPVIHTPEMRALLPSGTTRAGGELAEATRRRRSLWPTREEARDHWAGREFFRAWTPRALALYVDEGLRDRPDGQVELKCPPEVEAAIFERGGILDPFAFAPDVTAPTLLLWATRGNFPRFIYERLAEKLSDARVEDVAAGHLVPMERPELVVEAVERFGSSAQVSVG